MKRKMSKLRLSPNEEARIIREELDRRRKLRIQQVREQQRQIALQIRREVEQRRQQELRQLEEQLREDWERRQREKLHTLQSLYLESLQLIGQSHRSAKETEVELAAAAQREEEHHAKAEERYCEALKELKIQKTKEQERQKRSINARKKALQTEKERSAKVARLPPPPPDPIQDIDPRKSHMVKRSNLNAFATTRYHMPESAVAKEPEALQVRELLLLLVLMSANSKLWSSLQSDARLEADLESRRLQELQREEDRRREEQLEKARVRGRQALRREQLEQDRERLLVELQHLQQTDLLRRRQQVSRMPPQIFQPLYQRQEAREELQRELEFAFEDMYTGERRVKGDLVVQLVPEPLPTSSSTDLDLDPDQDLDVTVDENAEPEAENIQNDFGDEVEGREQEAADGATPPRQALRKLLDRIRSQRTDWINGSSQVPAADSPSVDTELIPERDMSIETGSLTPEALSEPGVPAPTVEPAEPPPAAERSLPANFLSRIQEAEEERKKREAELEVEKQQQLALLQELEEQKAELEQMLQEAQREREQLRAAAQQEALLLQPQVPVQDRSPISLTSEEEAVAPAEEGVSTRRLRQYQQRLLEQNRCVSFLLQLLLKRRSVSPTERRRSFRIHQRSVEVARQRLEEYQRALRIRHNLTATALLRPPVHPAFLAPPSESHPATPSVPSGVSLPAFSSSAGSSVPSITNRFNSLRPDAASLADSQRIMERVAKLLPDRPRASPVAAGPYEPDAAHGSASSSATFDPMTLTSREADRRRRVCLQEAQRRVVEQRAALMLQKEQQEEERLRAEEELQHMRRQKEALQALIDADRRSGSDSPSEASDPQEAERKRLQLLATLLRAIEESNGGSLSHLEEPEDGDDSLQPDLRGRAPLVPSVVPPEPSGLLHPPRNQKPPVTRVKLGFKWMIPQQHELSAIQEVETPVNMSRVTGCRPNSAELRLVFSGPEDDDPSHPQEGSGFFSTADRTALSVSVSSCRPDSAGRRVAFLGPEDDIPSIPADYNLRCRSAKRRVVFSDTEGDMRARSADGNLQDSVHDTRQSGSVSSCRKDSAGRRVVFSGPEDDVPSRLSDVNLQDSSAKTRVVSSGPENDFPLWPADSSLQGDSVSLSTSDRTAQSLSVSSFRADSAGRRVVFSGPEDAVPSLPAEVNLQDGSVESRVGSETSCRLPWRERLLSGAATTPESSDSDSAMKATSPPCSDSGRGADSPGPAALSSRFPSEALCRFAGSDCLSSTTISSGSYVSTDPEQNVADDPRLFNPTGPGSGGVSCAGFRDSSVPAGLPVDSVFNDSVIQRIIDKYTRELDVSLSAAGTTTDSDALEESGSSLSQPSRTEDETSARRRDVRRHPTAGQDPNPEQTTPGHPALERFCPVDPDQNPSCLAPERLSVLERLVGQPSAHSSMIGARPGPPDRSGWDSTLSRMIGRLSQQSDSPGPGFCAGHDTSERSWSDELPEEIRMRVLVGELQVSADQHSESSGERSSAAESREPSGLQRCLAGSPPASNPVLQNRAGLEDLDPHGADDSFHLLQPEITHNETAEPSVTFQLPDLNTSDDPSLEQLRVEEPHGRREVQESFSRLVISECVQQDSVLMSSPALRTLPHVSRAPGTPPHVSPAPRTPPCVSPAPGTPPRVSPAPGTPPRVSPAPRTPPCGFREASALGSSETKSSRVSVPVCERQEVFSTSEITPESDEERGILEQSQITLVSLTDTTLQDAVATDDEGLQDGDGADSITDGQETMETEPTEGAESTLAHQTPSASLLVSLWSPGRNLQDVFQQRRRVLMQRSDRRVQEIKAKRAAARNGPGRVLVEGRDPGRAAVQTVPRKETAEDRKRAERKLRPPPPGSTPTTLISEHFILMLRLYDVTFYRIIRMFFYRIITTYCCTIFCINLIFSS
uniref:Centrosomal protein 295 n=1 Tax=Xiphophorus maculatus TaxID=8083 RepID=A0A3B5QT89_XIPMA